MYFDKNVFILRLKRLRLKYNITQEKLARLLNVSRGAVGHWESGTRTPNLEIINDIAKIFKTKPAFVLGLTNIRTAEYLKEHVNLQELFYCSDTPMYLYIYENNGTPQFTDVNNAALEVLGYTREEFLDLNPKSQCEQLCLDLIPVKKEEVDLKGKLIFGWVHITKKNKKIPVELSIIKFGNCIQSEYLAIANYYFVE